jgi:hypothetical protein
MRIKATFIGADNSCGYNNGMKYFIRVDQGQDNEIIIDRVDNLGGQCTYGTLAAFLRNWSNVTMYAA